MLGLELVLGAAEVTADLLESGGIFLVAAEVLLEQGGEVLQAHPLACTGVVGENAAWRDNDDLAIDGRC